MTPPPATRPRRTVLLAAGALVVAVAAIVVVLVAASDDDSAAPDRGVALSALTSDPRSYVGDDVTVSGDVAATRRDPRALALGDDTRETLLVVLSPDGTGPSTWPDPDDVVRVSGTVAIFRSAEAEQYGIASGDDPFLAPFDGQPMILAERIEVLEEGTTSPVRPGG